MSVNTLVRVWKRGLSMWVRLDGYGSDSNRPEVLAEAVRIGREAVREAPIGDPRRAAALTNLSIALWLQFQFDRQITTLVETVEIDRQALEATPPGDPDYALRLDYLAITLFTLSELAGDRGALVEAVMHSRLAVDHTPADHPERAARLNHRWFALTALFLRAGYLPALPVAVDVGRQALEAIPEDHPDRATALSNLGATLRTLFEATGQLSDLEEAIEMGRRAVLCDQGRISAAADPAPQAKVFGNLAHTLRVQFEQNGRPELIIEAVDLGRKAVAAAPADHPETVKLVVLLAAANLRLQEAVGSSGAGAEAVRLGRQAVAATPEHDPEYAGRVDFLGLAVMRTYVADGRRESLDEAAELARQAVAATPADHPMYAGRLVNLGIALDCLSDFPGQREKLDQALALMQRALSATRKDDPTRAKTLDSLGLSLAHKFEQTGLLEALHEAVTAHRQAVDARPVGHPDRARALSHLGRALRNLWERTGQQETLAEAVEASRQAVEETLPAHYNRGRVLGSLGVVLKALFDRTERRETLAEAIQVSRQAVEATPIGQPERAWYLSMVGSQQLRMFEVTGDWTEMNEAWLACWQAIEATPVDHPRYAGYVSNLAIAMYRMYDFTDQQEGLAAAVDVAREAVHTTRVDHPDLTLHLFNLGIGLERQHVRTRERGVLQEARRCYRQAADNLGGVTLHRHQALRRLALLAVEAGDAQDGLAAIEAAIDLIDALAPSSLTRADRTHRVGQLADMASEAAAVALDAGQPERAVELLERTRGVLAADALGLRGADHARLRRENPDLARQLDQLRRLRDALDVPGPNALGAIETPDGAGQAALRDRRLADQRKDSLNAWDALLARIRSQPGFSGFLRSPDIRTLARYAHAGPIVMVSCSPARADALILTDTEDPVRHVPLPELNDEAVYEHANRLIRAYRTARSRDLRPQTRQQAQNQILETLAWLWNTVAEPVLTHLGHTEAPDPAAPWPRIWWCPVGLLAYLPLHAAGLYGQGPDTPESPETPESPDLSARPQNVADLVVSSYTPTVRALASTTDAGAVTNAVTEADAATLIVPVPDLPGGALPGVATETDAIKALIPSARVIENPNLDSVLAALPKHRIAHFACHGFADWDLPAASHLVLADHATTPLTVADITALRVDADLAYLSACNTAVTVPRLTDESLHITGAFHLAGYRHVIGTLWPIDDDAAVQIAPDFYQYLTADDTGSPRPDVAAFALHHATARLRRQHPDAPELWAAHTHTGM